MSMSQVFRDAKDREWKIHLTVGTLGKVRRETGLEFGKAIADMDKLTDILFLDPENLVRVLYAICDPASKGIEPEEFAEGFDGQAIEQAVTALVASIADFFRRPQTGQVIRESLGQLTTQTDQVLAETLQKILSQSLSSSAGSSASTHAN